MVNMNKNIIHVGIDCHKIEKTEAQGGAGIGKHVYNILNEINKQPELKDQFKFFLYFRKEILDDLPFLDNEIFVPKVAKLPFFFPFFRPSFNVFFQIALPFRSLIDKCDMLFFAGFMLPPLCFTKSIVVIPNDIYYEMNKKDTPLKYRLGYKLFTNNAALRATKVITQTNASREEIQVNKFLKNRDIGVIPLGVHIMDVKDTKPAKKEKTLFYLGQAFPRRHLHETLRAFEKIANEFPDFNFLAIGVDKYTPPIIEKTVKEINKKLGSKRIIRVTSRKLNDQELYDHYRKSTLFLYISSVEGMGMPPMEALAYGTAPVVADTPTTREIFKQNAFFVKDPEDIDNIAEVMREALKNKEKRERIEKNGRKIIDEYSWKNHTDSLLKLIKELV